MFRNYRGYSAGIALAVALTLTPADLISQETNDKPNLTGTWSLNQDESDDPREEMRKHMQRNSAQIGEGADKGSLPSGGRRPGGGIGGAGDGAQGGGSGSLVKRIQPAQSLVIVHNDPEFIVTRDGGAPFALFTDGRKEKRETGSGAIVKIRTQWKKKRIVAEIRPEGLTRFVRSYALVDEGTRLILNARIENPQIGIFKVKYVYDAVDSPQAKPPAEDEGEAADPKH